MRETQTVWILVDPVIRMPTTEGYHETDLGDFAYYVPRRKRFEYCGDEIYPKYWIEKVSRIVVAPEEYREDMIAFAKWTVKNFNCSNPGWLSKVDFIMHNDSELFDIYQKNEMSDNEINEDKITETELTTDEIWENAKGYTHSATALESGVWAKSRTEYYWKQRLIEEVEKARKEGYAAGFDAGYGEGVNVI